MSLLFPSCHASLIMAGGRVTSHHKQLLRNASLLPPLKEYIIQRNQWNPDTWNFVDWEAYSHATTTLSPAQHLRIVKFVHRWLPVGHRLHKQKDSYSARCSLCQAPDETVDHMVRCPDPDAAALRTRSLLSLKALLTDTGTDPTLCHILCTAITQWLHTGARHIAISPPADHPFCAQLYEAITKQNIIGWDQFFKGRLSKTWGACYTSWATYLRDPASRHPLSSITWATRLIKWAWDLVFQLWHQRNHKLFTTSDVNNTTTSTLRLQAQVRELYSRSQHLPRSDLDAYFREDLEQFQLRPQHVLEAWIALSLIHI